MAMQTETKPATRFWNVVTDEKEDSATLTLYGDVVSRHPVDWVTGEPDGAQYICPEDFAEDLEKIKDKREITIKINSVGGDVYTAIAIHNALKALTGIKTVIVDGIAASAASVIAMAGDKIKMYAGSLMMIHNVSALLYDWYTITDLKKIIRSFDAIERAVSAIYDGKTKLGADSIRTLMDRETWMTGAEAVAKGFADELVEGEAPDIAFSASSRLLMVNGVRHNTEGLHVPNLPCIKPLASAATAPAVAQLKPEEDEKEGVKAMDEIKNVEDLRAKFPELVAQIEADAVAKDRARIQEIEEIADTIGDAELVASAKFVKPTNAAALALAAMKKQAALGAEFINKRKAEQAPADKVQAAARTEEDPAAIAEATKAQEADAIKNTADLYKKIFK